MKLFSVESNRAQLIKSSPFKLEIEIQRFVEQNVDVLFDLEFVKSELSFGGFRLDTLCFDKSLNSFVIIEYKKGSSYSVIDQGYTYLSLLLNNKADFILEYNEALDAQLKRDDIDWSQSKVIFISPEFTAYQLNSVNFKNLPFELYEITKFSDQHIALNKVVFDSEVEIDNTIPDQSEKNIVKQVSKEIKRYDEDFHLNKSKNRPEYIREMYYELKDRILTLGDGIEIKYGKQTIGFIQNKIFTDLIIYNQGIGVVLNMKKGTLNDPLILTEDLSDKGHWGNGDYRIWYKKEEELEYVMSLIKQSYKHQL